MSISGVGATAAPHTVSGASWGGPPQQKMTALFNSIDTSGSGSVTQAQFQSAFKTGNPPAVFQQQGASATFAALDTSGSGQVSKQDFVTGMASMMASLRAPSPATSEPSPSALLAASAQALDQVGAAPAAAGPGAVFNFSA